MALQLIAQRPHRRQLLQDAQLSVGDTQQQRWSEAPQCCECVRGRVNLTLNLNLPYPNPNPNPNLRVRLALTQARWTRAL